MLTIGDLVTVDQLAEFRNDVQLDAFDKPQQNLGLLRSYLFSSAARQGKTAGLRSVSSVSLLSEVVDRFLDPRLENRLAAIADYGHGKSHLALALANYFSQPFASEETRTVLDKLEKAVNDRAQTARLRDFKEIHGEFLVVRLRGDIPRSLQEQFLFGLERALNEHVATRGVEMPFWYRLAEKALSNLSIEERQRTNTFLETQHLDIPLLIDQVQKRKDVYQLCVQLFTYLHNGMPPNLGGAVSLRDTVDWAAQTFCANGPLGGVLVLFDEFSSYVQRFAYRATGDLQDLLNGVDNQRGKVVFLAFGQHDPTTVADFIPLPGPVRDSLKHELSRIRLQEKFVLYSLMESIIDACLNQEAEAWKTLKRDPKIDTKFFLATSIAMECFADRYQQLRWSADQFQKTVTQGCFPLHPLTTAFLCNVKLHAASDVGTPRTVLGFVLEELKARRDQPALIDGRVNWVLPVELVDYFESRLAGENQYRAYESARRAIGLSAPEEQQALLKALLLQEIAGIKAKGDEQVKLLAQLAGLSSEQAQGGLAALVSAKCVRYDQLSKEHLFRSADGISRGELERIIEKQLENLPFDASALGQMTKLLGTLAGDTTFGAIPVDIPWGDKNDWAAKEVILTREFCTDEHLRSVLQPYRYATHGLQEDQRGAVVWLLARDEDDAIWYRENINEAIDATFPGDAPLPILCVVVPDPLPELVYAFQRWRALNGLRDEDRKKVGTETFSDERERAEHVMLETLTRLRGHESRALDLGRHTSSYAVPLAYRARVNGLATSSVRKVLDECYHLAYRSCPPEFLTQFRVSNNKLRIATKLTAKQLLRGSAASLRQGSGVDPVARDLCNKILYPKWRLLAPDSRVQEPGERHVRQAWDYLDRTFAPGQPETMVQEAISTLFNTPYGYDCNTATLLFSAWFGWHAHDLSVSALGHLTRRDNVELWLDRGPKEFLAHMCETQKVALARAEPGAATRRLQELIQGWKTGTFTQDQAQALRAELRDYCEDDTQEAANREAARKTVEAVEEALGIADEYETEARQIGQTIVAERDLEKLIGLHKRIEGLPRLANVTTAAAQPAALRAQLTDRLAQMVDDLCRANISLQKRTQLALNQSNLDKLQALLKRTGLLDLLKKVDEAQRQLELRAKELESKEQEVAVADRIRAIDPSTRLKSLYGYRDQLEAMDGLAGSTLQLRDQKLSEIARRITTLEGQADDLVATLAAVDSQVTLEQWREKALRAQILYDDTPRQSQLSQAMTHAQQLLAFFSGLASIQVTRWNTPDEAQKVEQQLNKLKLRYEPVLGAPQKAAVVAAEQAVKERIKKLREEAVSHLLHMETMLASGMAPEQLRPKLANPPAFLPAADMPRWQKLQAEVQDKLDRQKMDQALQERIRGMDPGARLVALYGYQPKLKALQELSDPTRQLRDKQLETIAGRIAKLEQQADELSRGLANITSAQALDAWRSRLLRAQALYDETPFQATLSQALLRADQLTGLFTELARVQDSRLPHPDEAQNAEQQLSDVELRYLDFMSESQSALVAKAKTDLRDRVQRSGRSAHEQLGELEKELEAGTSAEQLKAKVGDEPAFLPDEDLPRWRTLQAKVEARFHDEETDQSIRDQIQAMDTGARLVVLYAYRDKLQTLQPASGHTRQLRDKHLETIAGKIAKLEQDVCLLTEDLDSTNGLQALDTWRGRVHQIINQYEGAPQKELLEQALGQSERLGSYFSGLDRLANGQWSTPAEVEATEKELSQLENRYVAEVSRSQYSLLANTRLSLQEYTTRQRQAAQVELTDLLAKEHSGVSPVQLQRRLETPPAFLSSADLPEWQALQHRVQEQLDSDIIAQIEDKFRQITSRHQREECLLRLQKSIQESTPTTAMAVTEEAKHA